MSTPGPKAELIMFYIQTNVNPQLQKDLRCIDENLRFAGREGVTRIDVKADRANYQLYTEMTKGGYHCGSGKVPIFYNQKNKQWLCHFHDCESLKTWAGLRAVEHKKK